MAVHKKYDEDVAPGNSWGDTRGFHPRDAFMRKHGFRIHARPPKGPTLWRLGEVPYTESEAYARCEELELLANVVAK